MLLERQVQLPFKQLQHTICAQSDLSSSNKHQPVKSQFEVVGAQMADKDTDMIMVSHEEIVSIDAKPEPCIASVSDTKRENQTSEESYSIDDKPQPCVADDNDCQKEVSGQAIMELNMPETVKEAVMDDDIKINDLTDEIVQINPPESGANDDKSIHDDEESKEVAHNEDHMDVSSFSKKEDF